MLYTHIFVSNLEKSLSNIDLNSDPESILKDLISRTKDTIDGCFPRKSLSNRALKRAEQPWIDKEISKDEKTQSKLFRKFRSTKSPIDHKNYNCFRKKLNKKKKRRKKAYFRELIKEANAKKDFRKTWQAINKVLNKGRNSLITPTNVSLGGNSNEKTQCTKTIANLLNTHFTTIGQKLASKLQTTSTKFEKFLGPSFDKTFFLSRIELHEVVDEINDICDKKGMGFDNIPPKVIKWAPHIFAPILVALFNKCILLGFYPQNLKIARVVPIHKGGDSNDINNYRPISVLP